MKLAFTTMVCPEWSLEQILSGAVAYGYHGIEIRCDAYQKHGIEVWANKEDRGKLRDRLIDAGIEPVCLATSLQFVNKEATEESLSRIELAADIGCPGVRVFFGPAPEDADMEWMLENVARELHEAAMMAEEHGVELWLETHDTMSRVHDAAKLVKLADHRALGLVYDNLHPFRNNEAVADTFRNLQGLIRHVHFHDGINSPEIVVVRRMREGDMPVDDMFRSLVRAGYNGYVCGEWFHDQYGGEEDESIEAYQAELRDLAVKHGVKIDH